MNWIFEKPPRDRRFEFCAGALLLAVYATLFGRYILNDIDDAWTTAWVYNFMKFGETHDRVFMPDEPSYWGVRFFSHLYCLTYGAVLELWGYTREHVHAISLALAAGSLALWHGSARKIFAAAPDAARKSADFVLMLAASTVFFAAANKARVDMFAFFWIAVAVRMFLGGSRFFAALAACVAIETHPVGAMALAYLGAQIFVDRQKFFRSPSQILRFAASGAAGFAGYLLLHQTELAGLPDMFDGLEPSGNFLILHFFGREHFAWRFWPELALFAAATAVGIARAIRIKSVSFPLAATLLTVLFSLLLRRGNPHYALFCYPAILLLALELWGDRVKLHIPIVAAAFILLMIPQYGYLAYRNRGVADRGEYLDFLRRAAIPRDAEVWGTPMDWFALMEHPKFHSLTYFRPGGHAGEFYYIRHRDTRFMQPGLPQIDGTASGRRLIGRRDLASGGAVEIFHVKERTHGR